MLQGLKTIFFPRKMVQEHDNESVVSGKEIEEVEEDEQVKEVKESKEVKENVPFEYSDLLNWIEGSGYDVAYYLVGLLGKDELIQFTKLSSFWRKLATDEILWKRMVTSTWGPSSLDWGITSYRKFAISGHPMVGDVIEVSDTVYKWVVARVIFVLSPKQFCIYYEGWADFYNEWIDLERDQDRIRPLTNQFCCIGKRGPMDETVFKRQVAKINDAIFNAPRKHFIYVDHLPYPFSTHKKSIEHTYRDANDLLSRQKQVKFLKCTEAIKYPPPSWITRFPKPFNSVNPSNIRVHTATNPMSMNTDYTITEDSERDIECPRLNFMKLDKKN